MEEEGTERGKERPEQAASHHSQVKRDPSDVLIEIRQLHDEVVSLLAASDHQNRTGTSMTASAHVSAIEEGVQNEETGEDKPEGFDLSKAGRLPNDTYSLLVFAPVHSMTFAVSIAVFIIQIIALILLLLDFTDGASNNRLSMPVYVTWPLRVAQLFGVVMAAVSGRDVVDSLFILQNGYDEANLTRVLEDHYAKKEERKEAEHVTGCIKGINACFSRKIKRKDEAVRSIAKEDSVDGSQTSIGIPRRLQLRWYFSILLRAAQGLFNLACTFLLIMRSTDVRLVMLSYGAVAFVSNIDQMAFQLLALGFYGKGPIHHCRCKILTTLSSIDDRYRDNWRFGKKVRITSLASVAIFVALLLCWWGLASKQATGQFLTKSIYVQFGAEPSQTLYFYSGVYDLQMRSHNFFSTTGAVIYKERTPTGDYSSYFMYCDAEESWVFFPEKPAEGNRERHPCHQAWLARSSKVNSYNILSTASVQWTVQAKDRVLGLSTKSLMWDFRMVENKECDNVEGDTYGPFCEFSVHCEKLVIPFGTFLEPPDGFQLHGIDVIDDRVVWQNYNVTLNDVNRTYGLILPWTETYKVLRYPEPRGGAVLVYDRPVYYKKMGTLTNRSDLSVYSFILSSGRTYGRFVVVVPDEETSFVETEQEQMVRSSLDLYQLMMRGWQQTCGYEGKPQRWMCGYEDIFVLLLRFATHVTDKYVLLNPDSDTGNAISMQWNVIERFAQRRVPGQFSCGDDLPVQF